MLPASARVLVDCDRTSWNMDPDLLARELEEALERGWLPKAVVPTNLYGQCADYDRIFAVCGKFDVPVMVDAILGGRPALLSL